MRSAAEISTGADREQEASRIDISIRVPGPHCLWTDDYELDECPSVNPTSQRTRE